MSKYESEISRRRTFAIISHPDAGKTTLTEALVYFSGAAERMGRVEDGTTISDFDPEEAKRKASLSCWCACRAAAA